MAEAREDLHRILDRGGDVGLHDGVAEIGREADAQRAAVVSLSRSRYEQPGCGRLLGSIASGPTTWSRNSAASSTVLVSGPYTAVVPYSH